MVRTAPGAVTSKMVPYHSEGWKGSWGYIEYIVSRDTYRIFIIIYIYMCIYIYMYYDIN